MKTKLFRIPLWLLTGIALFFLASALYDFVVMDRSFIRYVILGLSGLFLIIVVGFHVVPSKYLVNQFARQMGRK